MMPPIGTTKGNIALHNLRRAVGPDYIIKSDINGKAQWNLQNAIGTNVFVINEVPNGVLNGTNTIFTTDFNFIPESVEVYVNGVKQKIIEDYNTSGTNTITLTFSPSSAEYILLNYIKQ